MTLRKDIDVSILIVSYNTAALTAEAIRSAAEETRALKAEIIVVDNASTDGSATVIANHPAQPKLIALDHNIGFARANNLAAKKASGRYILLLNPDTVVTKQAIDRLVMFAEANPFAKLWGGRTLFADGTLNPSSCWKRMTAWNQLCRVTGLTGVFPSLSVCNGEAMPSWRRDTVGRVDIVSGCFLLIERRFWHELGGFDPAFFMYGEDADLCLRARKKGARPLITPSATIIHYGASSEPVHADKMIRLLAAKMMLVTRHWPRPLVPLGRSLVALWPLTRMIAYRLGKRMRAEPTDAAHADKWSAVWRRRGEWLSGYAHLDVGTEARQTNATTDQVTAS